MKKLTTMFVILALTGATLSSAAVVLVPQAHAAHGGRPPVNPPEPGARCVFTGPGGGEPGLFSQCVLDHVPPDNVPP
jgi:hypothetical protein